jgi:isoquinoline 1-oxidoreductase alpha subunit
VTTNFTLNGAAQTLDLPTEMPLLWALRQGLGVTGPKFGCGMALCGVCTVFVDGAPVRACVTPLGTVAGRSVTTIEGLDDPVGAAVQAAWTDASVAQCGYCQAGQVMGAVALLRTTPRPTDAQIDEAMRAYLCRCGTYPRIRAAIHAAAERLAAGSRDPLGLP